MPERWQDELKKLRREQMPDGVRERAEAGPRRELPSDGRQRLVAGAVAFAVFIAAGAFAWRAFGGGDAVNSVQTTPADVPTAVVTLLESNPDYPTFPGANMAFEGDQVPGQYGRFDEWGSLFIDWVIPRFKDPMVLPQGTLVKLQGDAGSVQVGVIHGRVFGKADPLDVPPGEFVLPLSAGEYRLQFTATWPKGTVAFLFPIEVLPPMDDVPVLLHLTCTPDSATLDSSIVRAQPDGIHIAVDASDEVSGVEVVSDPSSSFGGVGGPLQDSGEHVLLVEPGTWHIGCYERGGGVEVGSASARFTVVDPEGVHTPVALACDEPTTRLFAVSGTPASGVDGRYEPTAQTVDESVSAVPGILATDAVREAGYVDGPGFKSGPLYTVLRDGRALARLRIPVEVSGSWGVSVDACPGSGIGPDAPPGAAGPTPDTAVVRCLESRTQVAPPIVNAQADGLHLEVENVGGTQAVTVVSGWDRERTFTVPVADQGEPVIIVVPARPGRVQISCRSNGETDPGDDPFADRLSDGLQLQDPAGYFLPYAPTCDSSEEVPFATAGAGVLPTDDTIVRARVPAILDGDVVERAGYLEGSGDEGLWRVVRDGEVVAQILYPGEKGIACRGSGIGGA